MFAAHLLQNFRIGGGNTWLGQPEGRLRELSLLNQTGGSLDSRSRRQRGSRRCGRGDTWSRRTELGSQLAPAPRSTSAHPAKIHLRDPQEVDQGGETGLLRSGRSGVSDEIGASPLDQKGVKPGGQVRPGAGETNEARRVQ